jgi:hypothetical protein
MPHNMSTLIERTPFSRLLPSVMGGPRYRLGAYGRHSLLAFSAARSYTPPSDDCWLAALRFSK